MKQIRFIIIAVLLLSVCSAFANTVFQNSAVIVAKNWYNEKQGIFDAEINNVFIEEENSMMMYYVFNFVDGGYIIVSAENNAPTVLGYSSDNSYQEDNHPPQFDWLLGNYKQQITTIIEENLQGTEQTVNEWSRLSVPVREFQPVAPERNVNPLIESHWGQGNSWNGDCPVDTSGPGGNAVVGCVAVAQAQIMRYWEHPAQGLGSNSYYHSDYGTVSANFGATTYDWSNMPNSSPTNSSRELLFHCGVGVEMDYGPSSSGASSSAVDNAMEDYFYYNSNSTFKNKSSYNGVDWENMLKAQLDDGYPLYYRGDGTGGHAFNLDGYQNTNHFHFNWGWSGSYDGYYYLSDLTPGSYNFNNNQMAYFDLIPAARVSGHVNLAGGSGNVSYVDVDFERISTGEVYSFYPDTNGDFGDKNLPTGSYNITYSLNGYRDYVIDNYYVNATLLNIELPDVDLIPLMNGVIIVNQNGTGDFTNISYAVQAVDQSATIYVGPGTYSGENNKNISWNGNEKNIMIWGSGNTVIDCENDGRAFTINNGTEEDIIKGFTIINTNTNYNYGGAIKIVNGCPQVIGNTFNNCSSGDYPVYYGSIANGGAVFVQNADGAKIINNIFEDNSAFSGGAIYVNSSNNVSISNNTFTNNTSGHIEDGTDGTTGIAGAVHIDYDSNATISNNLFQENVSNNGSAALAYENSTGVISENEFDSNKFGFLDTLGEFEGNILGVCYDSHCEIYDNTFSDNYSYSYLSCIILLDYGSSNGTSTIYNNTFINNVDLERVIYYYNPINEELTNCIFSGNESYDISFGDVTLNYCNTYQSGDLGSGVIEGSGCLLDTNPQVDPQTYQPLWNSTTKSPCIDAGDPTITDDDDTPSDIGAVCAVTHKYDEISLPSPASASNGWKWLSFPALDNVYSTPTYDPDQAWHLLYDILHPDYSPELYRVYDEDSRFVWQTGYYWNGTDEIFSRTEGYKFKMNAAATLEVPGFKVSDNTSVVLDGNYANNWVGYWLEETLHVSEAFSDYWSGSNIYYIQHQEWTATFSGGQWWYTTRVPTLSYGDMVVVKCRNTISNFKWIDGGISVDKTMFAETEYFSYEEQADYVPLYIELDSNNMPQEIGTFVNGECIGATVVEDTLTQINAYVSSVPPGNIELELYYGSRSEIQHISSYNCVSSSNPNTVLTQLSTKDKDDAWFINLREDSSMTPTPEKMKMDNYPNPFNPTTTIAYSLPNDGMVELRVFNIKGQLVKTLVKGEQLAGSYETVWNGKDKNEKSVSSGIYFYKLSTRDKIIMKKMLMLK